MPRNVEVDNFSGTLKYYAYHHLLEEISGLTIVIKNFPEQNTHRTNSFDIVT